MKKSNLSIEELEAKQPGIIVMYDLLVYGDTPTEKVSADNDFYVNGMNRKHYLTPSLPLFFG